MCCQLQVVSAAPLGLVVAAAIPRLVGLRPLPVEEATPRRMHTLLLVLTILATAGAVVVALLMRAATAAMRRPAAAAAGPRGSGRDAGSLESQVSDAADDDGGGALGPVAASDVLPQVAKLVSSREFICVALAFAFTIAPMQLLFNLQELLLPAGGFAATSGDRIVVIVLVTAGAPARLLSQLAHCE